MILYAVQCKLAAVSLAACAGKEGYTDTEMRRANEETKNQSEIQYTLWCEVRSLDEDGRNEWDEMSRRRKGQSMKMDVVGHVASTQPFWKPSFEASS